MRVLYLFLIRKRMVILRLYVTEIVYRAVL